MGGGVKAQAGYAGDGPALGVAASGAVVRARAVGGEVDLRLSQKGVGKGGGCGRGSTWGTRCSWGATKRGGGGAR